MSIFFRNSTKSFSNFYQKHGKNTINYFTKPSFKFEINNAIFCTYKFHLRGLSPSSLLNILYSVAVPGISPIRHQSPPQQIRSSSPSESKSDSRSSSSIAAMYFYFRLKPALKLKPVFYYLVIPPSFYVVSLPYLSSRSALVSFLRPLFESELSLFREV